MNFSDKIVTTIPLKNLWTSEGEIAATRNSYLTKNNIKQILKNHPVEFVVANGGEKLKWITVDQCYDFWKSEVQNHVADKHERIYLDNFPENYAYIASEWVGEIKNPIILLEMMH